MKLRLGELTFDPDGRQLLHGSEEIHLSPKAFELLKVLVDHRPRAMSKRELHDHLWPETFVAEGNLASLVAEVRTAVGDRAQHPRFIRTAHRFGYAFCAEAIATTTPTASDEPGASFCWLVHERRRLPLLPGENTLGRDVDGGIHLDSPTISRRHARIVIAGAQARLEDLDSKNGTFVGEIPVSTAVLLKDGDAIRVGSVVLRFRMASAGGATATWVES